MGPRAHMPTDVSPDVGLFDRFAGAASRTVSRAPFFAVCLVMVFAWAVQGLASVFSSGSFRAFLNDKFQLEINTTTTIITFLLVALLQNSQSRSDNATQDKLNAVADGLADLMWHMAAQMDQGDDLRHDIEELRAAVGLEERESTTDDRGRHDRATVS